LINYSKVTERLYSPSFARESTLATRKQQQAFVILDNLEEQNKSLNRKSTVIHSKTRCSSTNVQDNKRTFSTSGKKIPPNWMAPWYDSSTSTI
jgi:hypothetical protein